MFLSVGPFLNQVSSRAWEVTEGAQLRPVDREEAAHSGCCHQVLRTGQLLMAEFHSHQSRCQKFQTYTVPADLESDEVSPSAQLTDGFCHRTFLYTQDNV